MTPFEMKLEIHKLYLELKYENISEEHAINSLNTILEALNEQPWESFQKSHHIISQELQETGNIILPLLLKFLLDRTQELSTTSPSKRKKPEFYSCGKNKYFKFYKAAIGPHRKGIRISTFSIPQVTQKEAEQYQSWTISLLNQSATTPINQSNKGDIVTALSLLALLRQLSKKTGRLEEFYFYCDTILDRLARDGQHQSSRDIAEEVVACSVSDNLRAYGHWCKMSLLNKQKNPIEATFNGCLMFKALEKTKEIPEQSLYRLLKSMLIVFRDCGLLELLKEVQNTVINYEFLDQYDKESLIVMSIYDKLLHSPIDSAKIAEEYASKHIEEILKRGKSAVESWYAIICNLINHVPELTSRHPSLGKIFYESENILDPSHTKKMRGMILEDQSNTKELIISSIERLHSTRNQSDHIHEISLLQLTASNLIHKSLLENDFEGILIGHRVKSDGALAFKLSPGLPRNALIKYTAEPPKNKKTYPGFYESCLKALSVNSDTKFIWIGESREAIYVLEFEDNQFLTKRTLTPMYRWSNWMEEELPFFGFDDTPKTGFLETREDLWHKQSLEIKEKLPSIEVSPTDKPIVLLTDIETSRIPHNLALTPKDHPQAICNSLTFDLYQSYKAIDIDVNSLSIWAPLTEEDGAIQMAHGRLTDYFPTQKTIYHTESTPPKSDHSDIKAFICHGGRNKEGGFNGLYPSQGKTFTSNHIFGSGKIAILFVCHGGHLHPSIYARTLQALTKTLILDGYESVISPAWSLNVVIPGPWLSSFTTALREGLCITLAVQAANLSIKDMYPVESAWGAMHLFGNPHIKSA